MKKGREKKGFILGSRLEGQICVSFSGRAFLSADCQSRELQRLLRGTESVSEAKSEFPLSRHMLASSTGRRGEERVIQTSGRI